jgi:hypothetical protein
MLPYSFFEVGMDFAATESWSDILLCSSVSLAHHGLMVGGPHGNADVLTTQAKWYSPGTDHEFHEWGMIVGPTQFGIDYYLWASGRGRVSRVDFLSRTLNLPELSEVKIPDSARLIVKPRASSAG